MKRVKICFWKIVFFLSWRSHKIQWRKTKNTRIFSAWEKTTSKNNTSTSYYSCCRCCCCRIPCHGILTTLSREVIITIPRDKRGRERGREREVETTTSALVASYIHSLIYVHIYLSEVCIAFFGVASLKVLPKKM